MPQQQFFPWTGLETPPSVMDQAAALGGGQSPDLVSYLKQNRPELFQPQAQVAAPASQKAPVPRGTELSHMVETRTKTSGNPNSLAEAIKALNARELESLKQQGLTVEKLKAQLGDLQDTSTLPWDMTGLAALTDAWTGSNFTQAYHPPETLKDRQAAIAKLQAQILGAEQGMSESEVAMLRSQLNNAFQVENLDYRREQDKVQNALEKERNDISRSKEKAGEDKLKILPASNLQGVSDGYRAVDMAADLDSVIDKNSALMGPVKGQEGIFNPYSEEQKKLIATFDLPRQRIGKMVEGGILRKEDEEKYARMLPVITDLPEVAKTKARMFAETLQKDLNSTIDTYHRGGYKTEGLRPVELAPKKDTKDLSREEKIKELKRLRGE